MDENPDSQKNDNPLQQPAAETAQQHKQTPEHEPQSTQESEIPADSRNMAVLCHLLGIFTGFLGPLVIWLIKKDEDKYVDLQGKEALNFQITVLLACFASIILMIVFVGFVLLPLIIVCNFIFCIIAAAAASKGKDYKYPVSLRLIS